MSCAYVCNIFCSIAHICDVSSCVCFLNHYIYQSHIFFFNSDYEFLNWILIPWTPIIHLRGVLTTDGAVSGHLNIRHTHWWTLSPTECKQIKAINTKKVCNLFSWIRVWHLEPTYCTLVLWILITGQKAASRSGEQTSVSVEWKSFIIHSVRELPAPVNRLVSHPLSHAKRVGIKWFCPPQRPELRLKLAVQLFPARLSWQVYTALFVVDRLFAFELSRNFTNACNYSSFSSQFNDFYLN